MQVELRETTPKTSCGGYSTRETKMIYLRRQVQVRIPRTRHHRCWHNHAGPPSPSSFSFCFSRRRLFAFQPMKPFRYRPKLVLAPASVDSSRYVISIPSRYTAVGRIPIKGGAMVDRERAAFSSLVGSSAVLLLCQNIKNKKRVVRLAVGSLPPPAFLCAVKLSQRCY